MFDKPIIRILDLPYTVHGFIFHDEDDKPVIVINARDSQDRQKQTYLHELKHLIHGDMYNPDYKEY